MVYLILCYFLISAICLWAGMLMYTLVPGEERGNRGLVLYLITGLIGVTAIGQCIALVFPLGLPALLFILFLCGLITCSRSKQLADIFRQLRAAGRQKDRLFFLCLLCFLAMILILNAGPVIMDDTESYHIQMVKWVQEFGSVPGIANLHLRFGFNSSWFVSAGLFNRPVSGVNTWLALNGLLSFWFCYYLLDKAFVFFRAQTAAASGKQAVGCLVILAICLINWPMIRGCATSSNYDFITTCCVIILFLEYKGSTRLPVEWLIWPAYLFTVRMMNFPLLILGLFYCLQDFRFHKLRNFVFCISVGLFLIIPFLARNVILSGYAFFPLYQLDFFSYDWKADRKLLMEISEYIKYFNRVNPMFLQMSETRHLGFPRWVGSWFRYLFTFDKWMLVLSFAGYAYVLTRIKGLYSRRQRIFTVVMIIQLLTWFVSAPDPRFAQGVLLFGVFMAIELAPASTRDLRTMLKTFVYLLSSAVLLYGISKTVINTNYRNFFRPRPLPVPSVQTIVVHNIELHIPYKVLGNWNPRCYDVELPCLYKLDPRLEPRGATISDGFRLRLGSEDEPVEGEYNRKN